jgi:hypothetical protein
MPFGPKSKKRRAFLTRRVNALAQAAGFTGAAHFKATMNNRMWLDHPFTQAESILYVFCMEAGY